MPRAALPLNYTIDDGSVLESFESLEVFTITTTGGVPASPGMATVDTEHYRVGESSVKCSISNGNYVQLDKTVNLQLNPRLVTIGVYLITEVATFLRIRFYLSSTSNFSKHFWYAIESSAVNLVKGWNYLKIHRDNFINIGGESWDNTMIRQRINVFASSGNSLELSFDSVVYNDQKLPRCLITFDDGYASVYTQAYNYMKNFGIKGTAYIISSLVGDSTRLTLSQLDDLYTAGWALSNHTENHPHLDTLTQSEIISEITGCTQWLIDHSYPRAACHLAYPYGAYNDLVLSTLSGCGIVTSRTTIQGHQNTPPGELQLLKTRTPYWAEGGGITLATAKGWIDYAIKYDQTIILLFHAITSNPVNDNCWSLDNFMGLIDYIVARKIKCVTIDEWYKGLTNPRYRSLPLLRTDRYVSL